VRRSAQVPRTVAARREAHALARRRNQAVLTHSQKVQRSYPTLTADVEAEEAQA
jgi:hypothetical protein